MCGVGEANPIKVNNPATIHGANRLIVKESAVTLAIKRRMALAIIRAREATAVSLFARRM